MKTSLRKCSLKLRRIGHTRTNNGFSNLWKHCYNSLILLFTKYKCTWLTAISMSLSRCITCHEQSHATKRLLPWSKVNFLRFVACYCYAINTNSRTIRSRLSQPTSAGKRGYMSELQAHHCMTLYLWTWVLCSVSFMPAKKTVIARIKSIDRN